MQEKWTAHFCFIIDTLMESAPRFLCDVMLARLARYLRAAGLEDVIGCTGYKGPAKTLEEMERKLG